MGRTRRTLPLPINVEASKNDAELKADVTTDRDELFRMFSKDEIGKECYLRNAERLSKAAPPRILPNPFKGYKNFLEHATDMISSHLFGKGGKATYACKPTQFSTGSYGWTHRGLHHVTMDGKEVTLNVITTVTVCGSKGQG